MGEEPAQPQTFAAAVVQPVVPVAAAHQRQAMLAEAARDAAFKRGLRVVEYAGLLPGRFRRLVSVTLRRVKERRVYIIFFKLTYIRVSGSFYIFAQRPDQPQQIVGAAGADALVAVRVRVPPVHDVALDILVTAGVEDALARINGADKQQIHAVLKLIAEADRAAALVEAAAPLKAAGDGLICAPAAEIAVERRASAAHGEAAEQRVPVAAHRSERSPCGDWFT